MARSATTFTEGNEGGPGRPEESSAQKKRLLEAHLLQLDIDEREGNLCSAADVRDTYAQFIRAVRVMLDGLGPQAAGAVATALKLDPDGLATVTDAVTEKINVARKMIVEEWQRIGDENHATGQHDSGGTVAAGPGAGEDAG